MRSTLVVCLGAVTCILATLGCGVFGSEGENYVKKYWNERLTDRDGSYLYLSLPRQASSIL
jgi:hypothetical protein